MHILTTYIATGYQFHNNSQYASSVMRHNLIKHDVIAEYDLVSLSWYRSMHSLLSYRNWGDVVECEIDEIGTIRNEIQWGILLLDDTYIRTYTQVECYFFLFSWVVILIPVTRVPTSFRLLSPPLVCAGTSGIIHTKQPISFPFTIYIASSPGSLHPLYICAIKFYSRENCLGTRLPFTLSHTECSI